MRRRRWTPHLASTGVLAGLLTLAAAGEAATSSQESALIAASHARLDAMNHFDVAQLGRYTHRDYVGTGDDGLRISKAALLKNYEPRGNEPPNSYGPMEDVSVHVFGRTGVVNYRIDVEERIGDGVLATTLRRTDVFVKEEGRWQAVSAQLTIVPVSHLTPAAADASAYDDYVGDYELFPGSIDRVRREGDSLRGEAGGEPGEFLPLGGATFFFRNETGQVTFVRDASGRVVGYRYRRCDGQSVLAKKIR